MNEFSKWKYILVAAVLLIGIVYALPILFPQQPAVQVSANRGATVDEALKEKVLGILQTKKIDFQDVELNGDRLLARFPNTEVQLAASDTLRAELGDQYTVALNLASTVPGWLRAIGANRMPLGLDLQGGVHFLLQVDNKAALAKMQQRYVDDIRTALRNAKIRAESVNPGAQGIVITLHSDADRQQAAGVIAKDVNQPDKLGAQPPLEITDGPSTADAYPLIAKLRDSVLQEQARSIVNSNLTTLRNRVNQLHVSEPLIQQQGADRIVVELPGVQDTAEAKKIIGAQASLEYHAVDEQTNPIEAAKTGIVPPDSRLYFSNRKGPDGKPLPVVLKRKVIVGGDELVDASARPDPQSGTPAVSVRLNALGGKKMFDFTSQNVGHRMAVVFTERVPETHIVDGKEVRTYKTNEEVISDAVLQGVFSNQFQTTGLGSTKEAAELAQLLRAGSLAAPSDIVEERVIGPSLGQDNIKKGIQAVVLGLLSVLIAAALYYHLFGLIADIALILNLILLIAVLSMLQATLTMPSIAGIVLTLGMAIDANVLICERVREELRNGSTPLASIRAGYEKAWATILDANVTHLLAALALLVFGSGPIAGFGWTLLVGILTSMFTSVTVTHAIVNLVYSGRKLKGLSVGGGYARSAGASA
ncbi:MAG TPA: protein translocase subunit SecD [Rudaea sp.]|nr:protein translocase subunit SecD [Rudaea sp.]